MTFGERARAAIELAFDENVKSAAMSEWFKLSGKVNTIGELSMGFKAALAEIEKLREQQLADAAAHFKDGR